MKHYRVQFIAKTYHFTLGKKLILSEEAKPKNKNYRVQFIAKTYHFTLGKKLILSAEAKQKKNCKSSSHNDERWTGNDSYFLHISSI